VIVAAAGKAARMGGFAGINKPYVRIQGQPLLAYSLTFFELVDWVDTVVVMAAAEEADYCREEVVASYQCAKVQAVLPGGADRQASVWKGLQYLSRQEPPDFVAVHDAARPFLSARLLTALRLAAQRDGAAAPGIRLRDTVKLADAERFTSQTLPREALFAVQTPQAFHFDQLYAAYQQAQQAGYAGTDDAALYERFIGPVRLVESPVDNIKLTTPEDVDLITYRMERWDPDE
jgi:2-C-methyl-D-erythritol 4-phosphate cytidylyltransferase